MSLKDFPGTPHSIPRSMSPSPSRRSVSFRVEKPILIACIGPSHAGRSSFTRTVAQLPQLRHSTTYCGSGIEEFTLNIDGQLVMLLDVPHLVEEDGDESEEARLLDEHIECAYKGRNHLSGLVMFSRITSRVPSLPLLCEGGPNSSFSVPPSLTLCTTSWHRIASTSSWGTRREALLHTRFPGAAVTRFDAELPETAADEAQQQALEVLRLAMRTSERAPGSVARRPLQPRASTVPALPTPPMTPTRPMYPVPRRARRESIRSIASTSTASSAADEVRSELMGVIEGLKAEVEQLRQEQEAQKSVNSRTRKRLSLASLRR